MSVSFGPTKIKTAAGAVIDGVTHSASFDTEWLSASGAQRIGFIISAASSTSSPTWDADLEFSPDGGTTVVVSPPEGMASETAADIQQLAGDGTVMKQYEIVGVANKNARWRLEVTYGGSGGSDLTVWYFGYGTS